MATVKSTYSPTEDPGSVPSTYIRQFTTSTALVPEDPMPSGPLHTCDIQKLTYTPYTHK